MANPPVGRERTKSGIDLRSPGLWMLLAGLEFLFLLHAAEFSYHDYNTSEDVISALATGPIVPSVIFTVAVIMFGMMALAAAHLLRIISPRPRVWLLLSLSGIGAIGVGVFNMDDFPEIHAGFALVAFLFGNLATGLSYKMVRRPVSFLFPVLGLAGLSALVLYATDMTLGLGHGGMERMIMYPPMFWAISFGAYLVAERTTAGRQPGNACD